MRKPRALKNDLSGKKFGKLTVIKKSPTVKYLDREYMWECLCDCGNEVLVFGGHLKQGDKKSCGCSHQNKSLDVESLIGQVFKGLQIVEFSGYRYYKNTRNITFICKCLHCNKLTKPRVLTNILKRKKDECSCNKPYYSTLDNSKNTFDECIFINQSFNDVLVKEFLYFKYYKSSRQPFYNCECINCKKTLVIGLWNLKKASNHCRCLKNKKTLENQRNCMINKTYKSYINSANKRNLSFSLSLEDFKTMIFSPCHYCGLEHSNLYITKKVNDTVKIQYNGIDRKNSNLGYFQGNCVPCCCYCNRSKLDMDYEQWLSYLDRLVRFRSGN